MLVDRACFSPYCSIASCPSMENHPTYFCPNWPQDPKATSWDTTRCNSCSCKPWGLNPHRKALKKSAKERFLFSFQLRFLGQKKPHQARKQHGTCWEIQIGSLGSSSFFYFGPYDPYMKLIEIGWNWSLVGLILSVTVRKNWRSCGVSKLAAAAGELHGKFPLVSLL